MSDPHITLLQMQRLLVAAGVEVEARMQTHGLAFHLDSSPSLHLHDPTREECAGIVREIGEPDGTGVKSDTHRWGHKKTRGGFDLVVYGFKGPEGGRA